MKQYLLIPIEALKECDESEYYHLGWIKSKGEIVEIEDYFSIGNNRENSFIELSKQGYKLIKTIK